MTDATQNQSAQEQAAEAAMIAEVKATAHRNIEAKYNRLLTGKEFRFGFKTDKETGVKRPTVDLVLPTLSVEGIVDILENGEEKAKQLELLLEALSDVVYNQARSIVNDNEEINQENFPYDKVTWEAIANMPKAERRGGGISKETWEEFVKDYIEVMPGATGKPADKVALAAKLFLQKLSPVRTQKAVIQMLQGQLGIYINNSPNAEQYTDCVEFLNKKAEAFINADPEALLEAL